MNTQASQLQSAPASKFLFANTAATATMVGIGTGIGALFGAPMIIGTIMTFISTHGACLSSKEFGQRKIPNMLASFITGAAVTCGGTYLSNHWHGDSDLAPTKPQTTVVAAAYPRLNLNA